MKLTNLNSEFNELVTKIVKIISIKIVVSLSLEGMVPQVNEETVKE